MNRLAPILLAGAAAALLAKLFRSRTAQPLGDQGPEAAWVPVEPK